MPESEKSGPPMFWEFDSQWPDARILKKRTPDILRTIFIQTIATYQKLKKSRLWQFENNFYSDNCYIPEAGKSGLRHFENNFYSDNCYIPETEKTGHLICWEFDSQWPDARNWKNQTSDVLRIWFTMPNARKWKKRTPTFWQFDPQLLYARKWQKRTPTFWQFLSDHLCFKVISITSIQYFRQYI